MTLSTSRKIEHDAWVKATWDDFVTLTDEPEYETGRGYFDGGRMRIEMAALGPGHGRHNSVVMDVVTIYALCRNISLVKLINSSFRKTGLQECQPDVAFYVGINSPLPPQDNTPIDVDVMGSPNLVIEIGGSSFQDDLGAKRLLYERFDIQEYWVVDVAQKQVIAFSIAGGRSGSIQISEVLSGLRLSLVEEALERSQTENDIALVRWLMKTFSS